MWQSFSKNGKIMVITSVVLFGIVLFSTLRDNSKTIKKQEALNIIERQEIQKAIVAEPYLYLHTEKEIYKVIKDAIDMDIIFDKTFVEYKNESANTLDILMFLFIIGFTFYIVSIINESRMTQENFLNEQREDDMTNNPIPDSPNSFINKA